MNAKRDAENTKTAAKKKGGAAALRAQSNTVPTTPVEETVDPNPSSRSKTEVWVEVPTRSSLTSIPSEDDRAISPISTASSASEPPLAQRAKVNGTSLSHSAPPAPVSSEPSSSAQKTPEGVGNSTSPAVDVPDSPASLRTSPTRRAPVSFYRTSHT